MADYLLGISGDCADCSADDPCDSDGPTDAVIDPDADAGSWSIESEIRLHDLNYTADPQIFIVMLKHNSLSQRKMVAVRSTGVGIVSGATLSMTGGAAPDPYMVRTSHSGNTFSIIRPLSTSTITNYSVNPSTLVITQISGLLNFTAGYHGNAACFARDNEVGLVEVTELPGPGFGLQYHYWTVAITGGGTGITENARINETVAGKTAPAHASTTQLAKIERIDDDFMIAHRAYDGVTTRGHARGLDNTGALALGATVDYKSDPTDGYIYQGNDEENDDGQMITMQFNNGKFTPFFFRYVTVGTTSIKKRINTLNTSTAGLSGVDGSEQVAPITITGLNITFGADVVVATGTVHLLRGLNATKSVHFYTVATDPSRAELLG